MIEKNLKYLIGIFDNDIDREKDFWIPIAAKKHKCSSLSLTHRYFGWKGVFYQNYRCFVAELSPSGVPVYDKIFFVPRQLEIFVKEL